MAQHDVIFLENRRTPKIVPKGGDYKPSDAEGKITKRRPATAEEEKTISRGDWVRVNEHGDKPSDPGYKRKKSKVRPGPHTNSLQARDVSSDERDNLADKGHAMPDGSFPIANCSDLSNAIQAIGRAKNPARAKAHIRKRHAAMDCDVDLPDSWSVEMFLTAALNGDGYDGVTHAGIAMVAADTGRVLLAQRAMDATDDPDVRETWEFPGGSIEDGEAPFEGATREFREETGLPWPAGEVTDGWRSTNGVYQGFVYEIPVEFPLANWTPTDETQALQWVDEDGIADMSDGLRPEVADDTNWDKIFNDPVDTDEVMAASAFEADDHPDYTPGDYDLDWPVPVHGVVAPEEVLSGDGRGFGAGAMNKRPLRLPLRDQPTDTGGHNGAHVVGSVDRMMRSGGLVHWEGALMPETADDLANKIAFFGGRYGVSVDGDQGALDDERSQDGSTWFSQVRAAGLTAVDIPAFHEAYIAFGPHPDMPADDTAMVASGALVGQTAFARGPGWVTDPKATNRIHAYWTQKGQPGYAKVAWGTPGDFTRAKKLIGAKIAEHSPTKIRFLNQIIAQWHHDALGYWPGDLGKPGNAPDTPENRRRAAEHAHSLQAASDTVGEIDKDEIVRLMTKGLGEDSPVEVDDTEDAAVWEAVLVSSVSASGVSGNPHRPSLSYFHQHPSMVDDPFAAESGALIIEEPDEFGFRRTWGYAAEWGVCHVGMNGQCVEPPQSGSNDYPAFHLGRTKTDQGYVYTGVLTYGVGHRDAKTMLSESPDQAYFDNVRNAWAAARIGENERGIWFSGVVLPKVDADDVTAIEASGQVSGEWLAGALRACLTVNTPGFPNERGSVEYDEFGNVLALAASAFGVDSSPCTAIEEGSAEDPVGEIATAVMARIEARTRMSDLRFKTMREDWEA